MDALKGSLRDNLRLIGDFARRHNLDGFAAAFDSGLARLTADDPFEGIYHRDLAPDGALPLAARQLLGAAQAAWVFGGMGSWNDVSFEAVDQAHYERLSEDLFQLLNTAIVVGANASAQTAPPKQPRPRWKLGR
ncbi:MAG TPA: hypothetical protein VFY29_19525 [Terriglobia bacterium]|nr:hypothetical protein [Terriglobia bacterium]